MKIILAMILCTASCGATEWFDISPKPAWHTGPMQTYQNPAQGSQYPWEYDGLMGMKFETAFGMTAGMSGDSHARLMKFQSRANSITNKYLNAPIPTSALDITKTYTPVILLINDFYDLEGVPKGDGYQLSTAYSAGFSLQNVFLPRDAISFRCTRFTYQGWRFTFDQYLNENLRIGDYSSAQWQNNIAIARNQWPQGYNNHPVTPDGQRYADKLAQSGYNLEDAMFLAYLLEGSGLDFDSESADTFYKWLMNTLNEEGESILTGDILGNNQSGIHSSVISILEFALTYSVSIDKYLTFGITPKYMMASRDYVFRHGRNSSKPEFDPFDKMEDTRHTFGLDLGVVYTPNVKYLDQLALSFSVKNANVPQFEWDNEVVKLDPQFRMGISIAPFTNYIPIVIGFDFDLNRVESYVLPGYHTQLFRFQVELDPKLNPVNFALRFGAVANVGDANEPLRAQAGLNLKLWWFTFDIMGDTSFTTIERSAAVFGGYTLPDRFSVSAQLGFNIKW